MNEENPSVSESGGQSDSQDVQTVEAVIYTEQLDKVIEGQQMQFGISLVFIGLFLVLLLVSVVNRYM